MTRKRVRDANSATVRVMALVLSLFVLVNVGGQIYIYLYTPYKSEVAMNYQITESVGFEGVYVRDEQALTYDGSGVISYLHEDGSKVAKDSSVATVYGNARDVDSELAIRRYQAEIALLQRSQDKGTTEVAQQESVSRMISERQMELVADVDNGDLEAARQTQSALLELMNILQVATGKAVDFNARIQYLQDSISSLQGGMEQSPVSVMTDRSGYFVSVVDGYEDSLTLDTAGSLTMDEINAITGGAKKTPPPNAVGKIIDSYAWKLVGIVDAGQTELFRAGRAVTLRLASYGSVQATVDSIEPQEGTDKAVIILACDRLVSNLTRNRTEWVEMSVQDYEGIRVPRAAVRFYEDEKGVFIKFGQEIRFRKINTLFETDDYVIVEQSPEPDYLQVYDEVITKGKDLYDRKPLKG